MSNNQNEFIFIDNDSGTNMCFKYESPFSNNNHPNHNEHLPDTSKRSFEINKKKLLKANERYSILPDCFEKSLLKCLLAFGEKMYALDELNKHSEISKEDIEKECVYMKQRLDIEGIKSFVDVQKIENTANKFNSMYCDVGMDIILDIHKTYQVLDVDKIRELYEKAKTEAETIKDEDIILLLGPTGCGKSTTIQYLMGSVMEKVTIDGLSHIQAKENIEDPSLLDKVKTSPYPISETNCILTIGLKKSIMRSSEKGFIFLCDTPGFGDTNGCEVDIINSIGIIDGIKKCKSVRPLIVISYEDAFGKRMQGLAALSHILSGMIHNVSHCEDLFQFLFTKFPQEKKSQLKRIVELLIEDQSKENSDPCFLFFLDQLLNDLSGDNASNKFIDPLSGNRINLLKSIYRRDKMDKPSEYFKCSFDDRSKEKLKEQVLRHQLVIQSCIKNNDYSLVRFKLNELVFLKDKIDLGFIKNSYEECIRILQSSINENFNLAMNNLTSSIENSNTIGNKCIDAFRQQMEYALKYTDKMKKEFNLKEIITSETLERCLVNIGQELTDQINAKELDDDQLKLLLDKLLKLSVNFDKINYSVNKLYDKLQLHEESFMNSIKAQNFKKCSDLLKKIKAAQTLLQDHLDHGRVKEIYERVINSLVEYLKSLVAPMEEKLQKAIIGKDEKIIFKSNLDILQACKSDLADINDMDEFFETIYEKFVATMLSYLENIQNKVKEEFSDNQGSSHNLAEIETCFESMNILFEISDDVKQRGASYYYCTLDIVFGYTNELRRDIENEIQRIGFENDNTNTYKRLYERIKCLEEVKWIDMYKPGTYANVKNSIQTFVLNEVRVSKEIIEKMSFDLENYENITKANGVISKMMESEKMADFIPEIKEVINEAKNISFSGTKMKISLIL